MDLGGVSSFTSNGRHRVLSKHRGACPTFIQLFTQCFDLFLDHLLECRFLITVIDSKKNQGRDTTQG